MMASTQRQLTTFILGCFKGFKFVCWGEPPLPNKLLCQLFLTSSTCFWLESSHGSWAQAFAFDFSRRQGENRDPNVWDWEKSSAIWLRFKDRTVNNCEKQVWTNKAHHILETISRKKHVNTNCYDQSLWIVHHLADSFQTLVSGLGFPAFFRCRFCCFGGTCEGFGACMYTYTTPPEKHRCFTAPGDSVIFWWVSSIIITLSQRIARTKHLIALLYTFVTCSMSCATKKKHALNNRPPPPTKKGEQVTPTFQKRGDISVKFGLCIFWLRFSSWLSITCGAEVASQK